MFATISLIILTLAFLGGIIGAIFSTQSDNKGFSFAIAALSLVITLIVGFFSLTATVQAKEVGVLTTFGKPSDRTLEPGLSLTTPTFL